MVKFNLLESKRTKDQKHGDQNNTAAIFVLFNKVWQAVAFFKKKKIFIATGDLAVEEIKEKSCKEKERETCVEREHINFFGLEISMKCIK